MKAEYISFYPNQIYSVLSLYDASYTFITPYDIPEEWLQFFFVQSIDNIVTMKNPPDERASIKSLNAYRESTVEGDYTKFPKIPDVYPAFIVNEANKDIVKDLDIKCENLFEKDFPKWATDNIYSLVKDRKLLTKLLII